MDLSKEEKAKKLLKEGKVKVDMRTEERIYFTVKSNHEHSVFFDKKRDWFCSCKYFSLKQEECSHILACKMYMENEIREKSE